MKSGSSPLGHIMLPLLSTSLLSLSTVSAYLSERDTLIRFYNSANGARWKKSNGWKEAAEYAADETVTQLPLCSWHGVTCGSGDHTSEEGITGLDLSNNHLSGHVPKQLWALPWLTNVNFQGNTIHDAGFEGFGTGVAQAPVETIIVSENRLTHVNGISDAPNTLRELRISSNSFDGRFPEEVFKLKKLKILYASYNQGIVGTLPTMVGNMLNLHELELSYTNLKGAIPAEIGNLSLLQYLGLDECRFKGPLPAEIGDLINLHYLSIQNNEADSGEINGPLPSWTNLGNLRELYLNSNALTGSIPTNFLENSVVTDKLVTIGLKNNQLVGKLPHQLSRFEKLQLDVQGNHITGIPNELCKKKKWNGGQVGVFGCDAILCPKGTFTKTGRRESEEEQCEVCPNGEDDAQHLGSSGCLSAANDEPEFSTTTTESKPEVGTTEAGNAPEVGMTATESTSQTETAPSEGALGGGAKFFIILVALAVPVVIGVVLRKAYIRAAHSKDPTVVIGPDGAAPSVETVEEGMNPARCVL